jgi:hypothetical protein
MMGKPSSFLLISNALQIRFGKEAFSGLNLLAQGIMKVMRVIDMSNVVVLADKLAAKRIARERCPEIAIAKVMWKSTHPKSLPKELTKACSSNPYLPPCRSEPLEEILDRHDNLTVARAIYRGRVAQLPVRLVILCDRARACELC